MTTAKQRRAKKQLVYKNRPPVARFRLILLALKRGPITCARLADELEMSHKTIYRDVEFMQDRLELPIETDWRGIRLTGNADLSEILKSK